MANSGWEVVCETHGTVKFKTQRWFNFRDAESVERDHLAKNPGCKSRVLRATTPRTSSARGYHA